MRHDLSITLPWMRDGTDRLLAVVDRITDEELRAPSGLPGWTRAHVIGHLARNAEALGRLADWAQTGVETPMYADSTQRAAEIESSATLPPAVLRDDLTTTAARLDHTLAGLDDVAWHSSVRSALGRTIPAAEIPWLRVREVWLHAVDLAAGATVGDLPNELVDALLSDVTETLSARPGCPSVSLAPTDRDHGWCLGPAMTGPPVAAATAAELLAWLAGRDGGLVTAGLVTAGLVTAGLDEAGLGRPPTLPRWL